MLSSPDQTAQSLASHALAAENGVAFCLQFIHNSLLRVLGGHKGAQNDDISGLGKTCCASRITNTQEQHEEGETGEEQTSRDTCEEGETVESRTHSGPFQIFKESQPLTVQTTLAKVAVITALERFTDTLSQNKQTT